MSSNCDKRELEEMRRKIDLLTAQNKEMQRRLDNAESSISVEAMHRASARDNEIRRNKGIFGDDCYKHAAIPD